MPVDLNEWSYPRSVDGLRLGIQAVHCGGCGFSGRRARVRAESFILAGGDAFYQRRWVKRSVPLGSGNVGDQSVLTVEKEMLPGTRMRRSSGASIISPMIGADRRPTFGRCSRPEPAEAETVEVFLAASSARPARPLLGPGYRITGSTRTVPAVESRTATSV